VHGADVLARVRQSDPSTYLRVAVSVIPKEIGGSFEQRTPGNLSAEEWPTLRRIVDIVQANAKGAELGPVLQTIEDALRADQAKLIEAE